MGGLVFEGPAGFGGFGYEKADARVARIPSCYAFMRYFCLVLRLGEPLPGPKQLQG